MMTQILQYTATIPAADILVFHKPGISPILSPELQHNNSKPMTDNHYHFTAPVASLCIAHAQTNTTKKQEDCTLYGYFTN